MGGARQARGGVGGAAGEWGGTRQRQTERGRAGAAWRGSWGAGAAALKSSVERQLGRWGCRLEEQRGEAAGALGLPP